MYPIPMPASFFLFESYAKKNYNKKNLKIKRWKKRTLKFLNLLLSGVGGKQDPNIN